MINREIVRLKVVQLVYADYINNGKSIEAALKELTYSLDKTYDLYHYLLLLITNVTDYAEMKVQTLSTPLNNSAKPFARLISNRFARQLMENKQLCKFEKNVSKHWTDSEDVIHNLFKIITESDLYRKYEEGEDSYNADKEFWRMAYKKFVCQNIDIDNVLEEWNLYWNDDKEIIDTFVLKSIKRFEEANGGDQELLPAYSPEEDKEFAGELLQTILTHKEEYKQIIQENSKNWDLNRIAVMDIVIMECALAEIMNFPSISVNVSINEYLNLAKVYSTPKSAGFINGLLDHAIRNLRQENTILK